MSAFVDQEREALRRRAHLPHARSRPRPITSAPPASARRAVEDERLLGGIRALHAENYHAYGARRMWKALLRGGERVGRDHVARLMRTAGIQGAKRRGKPWRTTTPHPEASRRPDLVERNVTAERPNRLCADLTYPACDWASWWRSGGATWTSPPGWCVSRARAMGEVARALDQLSRREHFTGDDDLVFTLYGGPLDRSKITRRWQAALKRGGVRKVRFHDLRHTFASHMAKEGRSLSDLQSLLGHADPKVTEIYRHYMPSSQDVEWAERAFASFSPVATEAASAA